MSLLFILGEFSNVFAPFIVGDFGILTNMAGY